MRSLSILLIPCAMFAQTRLAQPAQPGEKTDDRIAALGKRLAQRPSFPVQLQLAKAYIQKMRETVDFGYLDRASRIVEDVIGRDGGNYDAMRLRSEIAMERHRFRQVAEYSEAIIQFAPNDPWSWGTLGDAAMELGQYEKARTSYEKMVSLKPDISSFNRIAWYRFVTGQADEAVALMRNAIGSASDAPENTAWCLADLANMQFKLGRLADARDSNQAALKEFPGYYPALAGLGRVEAAEGKNDAAILHYKAAQSVVPLPDYAAALEALYTRTGKPAEARKQRDLVDAIDLMARASNEKTNRGMALLYADGDRNLPRALELVENEIAVRPDVYTYDVLAWVLYKLKRLPEAEAANKKALALGTPDPLFFYHAGMIAAAQKNVEAAKVNLKRALELNPEFDPVQASLCRAALQAAR